MSYFQLVRDQSFPKRTLGRRPLGRCSGSLPTVLWLAAARSPATGHLAAQEWRRVADDRALRARYVRAQVPATPAGKVLGHADYGTTLKVYAHLDPKRAKAAAGRIDAALGRTLPALEDIATERANRVQKRVQSPPTTMTGGSFTLDFGDVPARAACKPSSVPRRTATTVIHLDRRSPDGSCSRPEGWAARLSPRRTGVAPSYLALLRVEFAAFHSGPEGPASSLWHWSSPLGGRALPATLRCGARTFLTPAGCPANARPSSRLAGPRIVGHG